MYIHIFIVPEFFTWRDFYSEFFSATIRTNACIGFVFLYIRDTEMKVLLKTLND